MPRTSGAIDFQPRVGHEIYVPGLFTQHYGKTTNLPIARFGHIARMPNRIEIRNPDDSVSPVVAYLAEFQSWGGQSGSPVFALYPVNLARQVETEDGPKEIHGLVHLAAFLGVCSGHYDILKVGKTTGDVGRVETALNSGIAIITPAEAVKALLMREDVVMDRAKVKRFLKPDQLLSMVY